MGYLDDIDRLALFDRARIVISTDGFAHIVAQPRGAWKEKLVDVTNTSAGNDDWDWAI